MQIKTSWSTEKNTKAALEAAWGEISAEMPNPSWLVLYASVTHKGDALVETLAGLAPGVKLHGGSSCLGAMTTDGFHSHDGTGIALWAIDDPDGDYGVGSAAIEDAPRKAGAAAISAAIADAGRFGQPPDLVWLTGVPGCEEELLLGIQDVIGAHVPIAGGSSADNTVAGNWEQYTHNKASKNTVVVSALYPSKPVHLAFHSGYSLTETRGIATRVEGRVLYEIDGRPAAKVYDEWSGGTVTAALAEGGNVLADTTLYPLARQVGEDDSLPYHRLIHPDGVTADGALTLFANLVEGDEIVLMEGTQQSLVRRAGRVATAALDAGEISAENIAGALVVYCAGCMLTVQDQMSDVAASVAEALEDKPFIGTFTFGEQGCFVGGENHHGNLMISVAVFEK